jgi:hypothetical protein
VNEFWQWLASSIGTIGLAILAGAGGSALLELLWKPRRDKRRAATLLLSEIALNTELLLLHAHVRQTEPGRIPADLRMSVMAWNATADLVSELPGKIIRDLVVLYNRYDSLNRQVLLFGEAVGERMHAQTQTQRNNADEMAKHTLNAFNSGVDVAIDHGQTLLRQLIPLAEWKESAAEKAKVIDYSKRAADFTKMRQEQLKKLGDNASQAK